MTQLQPQIQQELTKIGVVQADVGSRQQMLSQIQTELTTQQTNTQAALSSQMDTNMASALTQLTQLQTSMQATLQTAASTMQMSLFNYPLVPQSTQVTRRQLRFHRRFAPRDRYLDRTRLELTLSSA